MCGVPRRVEWCCLADLCWGSGLVDLHHVVVTHRTAPTGRASWACAAASAACPPPALASRHSACPAAHVPLEQTLHCPPPATPPPTHNPPRSPSRAPLVGRCTWCRCRARRSSCPCGPRRRPWPTRSRCPLACSRVRGRGLGEGRAQGKGEQRHWAEWRGCGWGAGGPARAAAGGLEAAVARGANPAPHHAAETVRACASNCSLPPCAPCLPHCSGPPQGRRRSRPRAGPGRRQLRPVPVGGWQVK